MTHYQEYHLYRRYVLDAIAFNADLPEGCHTVDYSWFLSNMIALASK